MGIAYIDIKRVFDVKTAFTGERLKLGQFGATTDTDELVIRRPDGTYRFISDYDDTELRDLVTGVEPPESVPQLTNLASDEAGDSITSEEIGVTGVLGIANGGTGADFSDASTGIVMLTTGIGGAARSLSINNPLPVNYGGSGAKRIIDAPWTIKEINIPHSFSNTEGQNPVKEAVLNYSMGFPVSTPYGNSVTVAITLNYANTAASDLALSVDFGEGVVLEGPMLYNRAPVTAGMIAGEHVRLLFQYENNLYSQETSWHLLNPVSGGSGNGGGGGGSASCVCDAPLDLSFNGTPVGPQYTPSGDPVGWDIQYNPFDFGGGGSVVDSTLFTLYTQYMTENSVGFTAAVAPVASWHTHDDPLGVPCAIDAQGRVWYHYTDSVNPNNGVSLASAPAWEFANYANSNSCVVFGVPGSALKRMIFIIPRTPNAGDVAFTALSDVQDYATTAIIPGISANTGVTVLFKLGDSALRFSQMSTSEVGWGNY